MKTSTTARDQFHIRRSSSLLLFLLLVLATTTSAQRAARADGVYIDPALRAELATLGPNDQIEAIVNFDPARTSSGVLASAIQNVGAGTVGFHNLDSVGVLATAGQIDAITSLAGVSEIYANRQLTLFMPEANSYIGADAVWNSL